MNHLTKICASISILAAFAGVASAQSKMAKAATCPVCHMPLASMKSKKDPVAVRLKKGGKVLYCCAGCKMPASMLVKK